MKEKIYIELSKRRPEHAEGYVCIDLTDPVTGKTKERVDGKNHVFLDSLFSSTGGSWQANISGTPMLLTDAAPAIDADFPYLLGNVVGYGKPNLGTSGTFRGAYNAASQVLAQKLMDKVRWKFVYNFTTPQANTAPIKAVGLSGQCADLDRSPFSGFYSVSASGGAYVSDGRYHVACSSAGVITKKDTWFGETVTIDVSSITGAVTSDQKHVGYNPQTGQWAVIVTSGTSANRKLHLFSDSDFTTLVNMYPISAWASNASSQVFYFYGNYMFGGTYNTNNGYINYVNYVTNSGFTQLNVIQSNYALTENGAYGTRPLQSTMAYGKYILATGGSGAGSVAYDGCIIDMETKAVAGHAGVKGGYAMSIYPVSTNKLFGEFTNVTFDHNNAITCYNLPAPVTKTSAYAMTATYELEVYW